MIKASATMQDYFKDISIRPLLMGFVILLVALNTGITIFLFSSFRNQGVAIDVSGRNRMLSQRVVLYAGIYVEENKQEAKTYFQDALALHDLSLERLKEGGPAPEINGKFLDPASGTPVSRIIQIENTWQKFRDKARMISELPLYDPNSPKSKPRINPEVQTAYQYLKENANNLLQLNNELVKAYVAQYQAKERWLYLWLFISVCLMLFLAFKWMARYFLNPIQLIAQASTLVSKGDYEQKIRELGRNEFGNLARALNILFFKFRESSQLVKEMGKGNFTYQPQISQEYIESDTFLNALIETQTSLQSAYLEDKNRNWMNEGYAKFGALLQSESQSLPDTAKSVLMALIDYLPANVGGIYIHRNDSQDGGYLELTASYAYDRAKFIQKEVLPGEGLIGEIFLEGKSKYMRDLPLKYTQIASGLHEVTPRYLLIVPIIGHSGTLGVLEIASIETLEDYKIDFVERVAQMLASTLGKRMQSEETQRLFQESQEMAERLQSSEEEMRQNMEELQTTQELMRRKEKEYLKVIEEMKREIKDTSIAKKVNNITTQN